MASAKRSVSAQNQESAILYFGLALPRETPVSPKIYEEFVNLGLASGCLPHPACCTLVVRKFLEVQATNPNSTFWKTWTDVIERSQTELFLHAIVHYFTTYGTNYSMPAYVPNDDYANLPFADLDLILPASEQEIAEKCLETVQSGLALAASEVEMAVDFIVTACFNHGLEFDIDTIKNREAKIGLCKELHILPKDPQDLLRLITGQLTDSGLLIKSKSVLSRISAEAMRAHGIVGAFDTLDEEQLRKLASIFYRFKPIFLAMRTNPRWRPIINRIRRMAHLFHKPLKIGVMESLLAPEVTDEQFSEAINRERNIWKLFRAYGYLNEEMSLILSDEASYQKVYHIRNGKVHVRTFTKNDRAGAIRHALAAKRIQAIEERILSIMSRYREATGLSTVMLPTDINLVVPESEKQFLGDIPFGSYFDLAKHNFVGVYWRNEWGTRDYDLSYIDREGIKLGWNTNYKNSDNSVVFSGDMTTADPEATEMFYCKGEMPDGIFKLNRFNGVAGSRARIFFGQEKIGNLSISYMVNPASIKFKADIFPEKRESLIGGTIGNRVYIFNVETGDGHVSTDSTSIMSILRRMKCKLSFEQLLLKSGYTILPPDSDEDTVADYDFRFYTKDRLIKFFADASTHNSGSPS